MIQNHFYQISISVANLFIRCVTISLHVQQTIRTIFSWQHDDNVAGHENREKYTFQLLAHCRTALGVRNHLTEIN